MSWLIHLLLLRFHLEYDLYETLKRGSFYSTDNHTKELTHHLNPTKGTNI